MTTSKLTKFALLILFGAFIMQPSVSWAVGEEAKGTITNQKVQGETEKFITDRLVDGNTLEAGKIRKRTMADLQKRAEKLKKSLDAAKKAYDTARDGVFEVISKLEEAQQKQENDKLKSHGFLGIFSGSFWGDAWSIFKDRFARGVDVAMAKLADMFSGSYLFAAEQLEDLLSNYNSSVFPDYDTINSYIPVLKKQGQYIDRTQPEYDGLMAAGAGGELYAYMAMRDDGVLVEHFFVFSQGKLTSITGATRGCIPLMMKLAESQSCIFCPLFKTIFNAAQSMATKAYSTLAKSLSNVMLIGFALYIAFMVLKQVSAFTKQDAPKMITELLQQIFKVLVAFYMLKNANIVYGYIVGPMLKAGFEFGSSLLFAKADGYLASCNTAEAIKNVSGGVMPTYIFTNLDCFIRAVQAEVARPQAIGSTLMCVARNAGKENLGPINNVLWDFSMMFQGLIIWVMGWLISLAFAFYLIDATVQLGIVGALMPFLIAAWPFKITKKYTMAGWNILMNTFFVYVFMGLVVSINVELLGQALTGSKGGFAAIEQAINANGVTKLKELLDIGFSGFLILIACCIFGFKLTGQASSLAGTMGHGGTTNIAPGIGGMAYGAATKLGGKALSGAGKVASSVGAATGATAALRRGKDAVKDKIMGAVGLGRRGGKAGSAGAAGGGAGKPGTNPGAGTTPGAGTNPTAAQQSQAMQNAGPRQLSKSDMNGKSKNELKQLIEERQNYIQQQQQHIMQMQQQYEQQIQQLQQEQQQTQQEQQQTQQEQQQQQTRDMQQQIQQLEAEYNKTNNGQAGQQMLRDQTNKVLQSVMSEKQATNKMNYHNKRADEYLKKAEKETDPAQKKNLENLANAQFEEAVKAEKTLQTAKANTQKAQNELNAIKQENEKYRNEYVQSKMKNQTPNK